jgi:site-specific DNA-methyltransferase (adenine-specific)
MVIVDLVKTFSGSHKHPVDIEEVENFVRLLCRNFKIVHIGIDQHQSADTVQKFQREGLPIKMVNITPKYNEDMYKTFFRRVNTKHIVYPNLPEIKDELRFLQKRFVGWGWVVVAARGHMDDIPDCLANLCLLLEQLLSKKAEWSEMIRAISTESLKMMFKSTKFDYATPQEIFDELDKEFHFTLDPCASKETAKCSQYFTEKENGLLQFWEGNVFMNPPYGRKLYFWIEKAYTECIILGHCNLVVCLIPSRTDTKWWHNFCMKASEIRFFKGRIKFNGKNSAPFPSCLVIFDRKRGIVEIEKGGYTTREPSRPIVKIKPEVCTIEYEQEVEFNHKCPKCGHEWTTVEIVPFELEPPDWSERD